MFLPMSKTSTIHFTVNNLASKSKSEIIDINECFGDNNENDDICRVLNLMNYDVSQEVVNSILDYASTKKEQ
jgi:hypothetical protein